MNTGASSRLAGRGTKGASAEDEGELVRAARGGDHEAFAALVKRYQNAVAGVAYALTGRFAMSEDVAQETFIVAWQRLAEIRQPKRFRSFVLGVARNKSLSAMRNQRVALRNVDLASIAAHMPSDEPSPLDRAITVEEERAALRALARIPENYRIPLVLFYREGLAAGQVARVLGLTEKNVRMRIIRGRRMVEQRMLRALSSALHRTRLGPEFTAAVVLAALATTARPAPAATSGWTSAGALLAVTVVGTALLLGSAGNRRAGRTTVALGGLAMQQAAVASAPLGPILPASWQAAIRSVGEAPGRAALQPPPGAFPVVGFDFEDGKLPESFLTGHVVPGPRKRDSQYVVMGTVMTWYANPQTAVAVTLNDVTYRDTLELQFDYWVEQNGRSTSFAIGLTHGEQHCQYTQAVRVGTYEKWMHAAVPLQIFVPRPACAGGQFAPGDSLTRIEIWGNRVGGAAFFLDNIKVVDRGHDDLRLTAQALE